MVSESLRLIRPLGMYLRINTIVKDLSPHKKDHIPNTYPNEGRVAGPIQRLVRFPIDLRRDDIRGLYRHVVKRRGHGTCAHCTSVATCAGDKNCVYVWIAHNESRYGISSPVGSALWDGDEGDEERQCPHLSKEAKEESLIDALGKPGPE
jgi:hypothetical protein